MTVTSLLASLGVTVIALGFELVEPSESSGVVGTAEIEGGPLAGSCDSGEPSGSEATGVSMSIVPGSPGLVGSMYFVTGPLATSDPVTPLMMVMLGLP
jgi:hypothetical protein